MTVTVEFPFVLPSMANARLHWAAKAKRVKAQRSATRLMLKAWSVAGRIGRHGYGDWEQGAGRLAVRLTRIAPRALDDDNLCAAFKAIRDEVAAYFGVDDADPRIEWVYRQAKGPACVVLEFDVRTVAAVEPIEARAE